MPHTTIAVSTGERLVDESHHVTLPHARPCKRVHGQEERVIRKPIEHWRDELMEANEVKLEPQPLRTQRRAEPRRLAAYINDAAVGRRRRSAVEYQSRDRRAS